MRTPVSPPSRDRAAPGAAPRHAGVRPTTSAMRVGATLGAGAHPAGRGSILRGTLKKKGDARVPILASSFSLSFRHAPSHHNTQLVSAQATSPTARASWATAWSRRSRRRAVEGGGRGAGVRGGVGAGVGGAGPPPTAGEGDRWRSMGARVQPQHTEVWRGSVGLALLASGMAHTHARAGGAVSRRVGTVRKKKKKKQHDPLKGSGHPVPLSLILHAPPPHALHARTHTPPLVLCAPAPPSLLASQAGPPPAFPPSAHPPPPTPPHPAALGKGRVLQDRFKQLRPPQRIGQGEMAFGGGGLVLELARPFAVGREEEREGRE